jgi:hypothetical protein
MIIMPKIANTLKVLPHPKQEVATIVKSTGKALAIG